MFQFIYEGDINGISDKQLEFISKVLEEREFRNEKVFVEAVGEAGDNYIASVKRITVEKNGQRFRMIAKVAPNQETLRAAMNTGIMFQNEHVIYTEILPKFTELEKAAGIPENERLRYAICYGSLCEKPDEIILLEDLKESDYIMFDRFVSLSDEAVKLVLKNFGILHSLSYALKNQEPETFTAMTSKLRNFWTIMDKVPKSTSYFQTIEKDVLGLLDNEKYKGLVKGTVGQLTRHAVESYNIDRQSKYSVIQQGDTWTNNIMFRLKEDQPVDCCMIDYQVSKESSPVADLQYMIFSCTDYETRSRHYHEWIDYYHEQLGKCLTKFGLKVNVVYPKIQLNSDLKRNGKGAFSNALLLATIMVRKTEDASKFKTALNEAADDPKKLEELRKSSSMNILDHNTTLSYKDRVQGLLHSFVELGYLE